MVFSNFWGVRKGGIYKYNLIHRNLILLKPGHIKVKAACIKRVLNQDCSVKPFTWNISSLYITIELYIYSLKSPSSYYVDVPSYKEMMIER
jgi:hypothetical protein